LTSVDLTNVRVQVELAWGSNNRRYAPMVEHLAADSVQLVLVAEDVPLLSSVSAYTVAADVVNKPQ
jgi:hypothetical protein